MKLSVLRTSFGVLASMWLADGSTSDPEWITPKIKESGKVVSLPKAAVQPDSGS